MVSKSSTRPWLYPLAPSAALLWLGACAHGPKTPETKSELSQAQEQIQKLQDKVQDLEIRLTALNEKINLENAAAPEPVRPPPVQTLPAKALPPKSLPVEVAHAPAAHSAVIPQSHGAAKPAFSSNEVVDRFREAKILYDAKRYPDAIVEFSDFLKTDPVHPLAASAQYHLGMSYFLQKEYKLAEEELSRGLIAYPRSSHIPDTLLALAEVSDALKKNSRSQYFREKLLSHFPNSPQAKGISTPLPEPKVIERPARGSDQPLLPEPPTAPLLPDEEHS